MKDPNEERWLLLAEQLEDTGNMITHYNGDQNFIKQIRIDFEPGNKNMWIVFHDPIKYIIYSKHFGPTASFSELFDSLNQKQKEIFVFYLDLMDSKNEL